ncbi:MAG: thymidine phosphorylase [Candidatus Hodarchaeales archaeon]
MKLKLVRTEVDIPYALINAGDFKHTTLTFPVHLVLSTKNGKYRLMAYNASKLIEVGYIGLSNSLLESSQCEPGDIIDVKVIHYDHTAQRLISDKIHGHALTKEEFDKITSGFVNYQISPQHASAFVLSQHFTQYTQDEIEAMARSFADSGRMFDFSSPVFDKHSIGGVPGNKITLLIVPILVAAGLLTPKTSTRAITSASGTADTMSVLAPVDLSADEVLGFVKKTKGCIVSGRKMGIAPVVDRIIQQALFPLGIDPKSLFLAGILAKKIAMGVDFMVLDIPVGTGTKVATEDEGRKLGRQFVELAQRLGIKAEAALTYASVPVGHSIGPLLEAKEALEALHGLGPTSLVEKSCDLAGINFELAGITPRGMGKQYALDLLNSGKALEKMREIIEAQGGDPKITPEELGQRLEGKPMLSYKAPSDGWPHTWNNSALKEIARAAGAPKDPLAGIQIISKKEAVKKGEEVFRVYASTDSALDEVQGLIAKLRPVIIESVLLERIA